MNPVVFIPSQDLLLKIIQGIHAFNKVDKTEILARFGFNDIIKAPTDKFW
jgi:hypothetical protein